jgi:hypothetical protein
MPLIFGLAMSGEESFCKGGAKPPHDQRPDQRRSVA